MSGEPPEGHSIGASICGALDHAPCGYLRFGDDGTVTQVNRTLCDLLGYGRQDIVDRHVEQLLTVGTRIFFQTHLLPMLRLHGSAEEIYVVLRTAQGEEIGVLLNATRHEGGGDAETSAIVVPILQRERFQDELLRAKKEAEAGNRAKARFLSVLSHDLRTPMSAVIGAASLLDTEMAGKLGEKQRELVHVIQRASGYLIELLDSVLNFATMDAGQLDVPLSTVAVPDVVAESVRLLERRFEEAGVEVTCACSGDVKAHAHAGRLQQVLMNLLTNAAKFTPRGGRAEVRCRVDGAWARIEVADSGPGVPEEEQERIFEAFEKGAATSPEGVGLGLSISRELTQAMGGDISLESKLGEGATFTITLRAASAAS